MAVIEMNWSPSNRDLRVFAVVQLIVAIAVAWIVHRRTGSDTVSAVLIGLSIIGLLIGCVRPRTLRVFFVMWMLAAFPIGWIMSHVVVAIVFYGVVTPIGLMQRMRGRDALQLKLRKDVETHWQTRPIPPDSSRYFRQF